jgi:hypothetical protein
MNQLLKMKSEYSGCLCLRAGRTDARMKAKFPIAPITRLRETPPNLLMTNGARRLEKAQTRDTSAKL